MFSFILTFLPWSSLFHSLYKYWTALLFHLTTSLFWFGFTCVCVSMCVSAFHSGIYSFLLSSLIIFIMILIFLSCMSSKFLWGTLLWEYCFLKKTYCYIIHFFIIVMKPKHLELGCFVVSLGMRSLLTGVFNLCFLHPNLSWFRPPE